MAWNYIDLRFLFQFDCQLEATLTDRRLIIRLYAKDLIPNTSRKPIPLKIAGRQSGPQSCYTCGEFACRRHKDLIGLGLNTPDACTTYLLDCAWPEFQKWIKSSVESQELVITPFPVGFKGRCGWQKMCEYHLHSGFTAALRSVQARRRGSASEKRSRQLKATDMLARAGARKIPITSVRLVVDVSFLAELQRIGTLGGRSYEVLMSRAPIKMIHEQLEGASISDPFATSLSDFRADNERVELEWMALCRASKIITPHHGIAKWLESRGIKAEIIDWILPEPAVEEKKGNYLYFPGPTMAREGAKAVRDAAKALHLSVSVSGAMLEPPSFWEGVTILSPQEAPLEGSIAVVHPAALKDRPTACLRALSAGITVIATSGCGISQIIEVSFGSVDEVVAAVQGVIEARSSAKTNCPSDPQSPHTDSLKGFFFLV